MNNGRHGICRLYHWLLEIRCTSSQMILYQWANHKAYVNVLLWLAIFMHQATSCLCLTLVQHWQLMHSIVCLTVVQLLNRHLLCRQLHWYKTAIITCSINVHHLRKHQNYLLLHWQTIAIIVCSIHVHRLHRLRLYQLLH